DDYEGAIDEYRIVIRLNPNHVDAHYNLGIELQKKGDLEGAINEYRAALRVNSSEADVRYNLAVALRLKGDFVAARKEFKKALKLIPKTTENQAHIKSIKSVLREISGPMESSGVVGEER